MAERRIVDIGPLLEDLKKELEDLEGSTEALTVEEATEDEIGELEALPVIDPASLRPTAKWIITRRMADGAECKCGNCGRRETFTTFDRHTDHVYCCRCGYRMDMGRNSEHYSDPTPGTAWENMRREEKRLDAARLVVVSALVPILRQTAELAGFEIIGRIPLRDKATGKEYR